MVNNQSGRNDGREPAEAGTARPIQKRRLSEKLVALFERNPLAWVLLALLIVAEHGNYTHSKQLDAVCDAITIPDVLPDKPTTAIGKAQLICYDRENPPDPDDE